MATVDKLFHLTARFIQHRYLHEEPSTFSWRLPHNSFLDQEIHHKTGQLTTSSTKKQTKPGSRWAQTTKNFAAQYGMACSQQKIAIFKSKPRRPIQRSQGLHHNAGTQIHSPKPRIFTIPKDQLHLVPPEIFSFAPPIYQHNLNPTPHPKICQLCLTCSSLCTCKLKSCLPCTHLSCPCQDIPDAYTVAGLTKQYDTLEKRSQFLQEANETCPDLLPKFTRHLETPSQP